MCDPTIRNGGCVIVTSVSLTVTMTMTVCSPRFSSALCPLFLETFNVRYLKVRLGQTTTKQTSSSWMIVSGTVTCTLMQRSVLITSVDCFSLSYWLRLCATYVFFYYTWHNNTFDSLCDVCSVYLRVYSTLMLSLPFAIHDTKPRRHQHSPCNWSLSLLKLVKRVLTQFWWAYSEQNGNCVMTLRSSLSLFIMSPILSIPN